MNKKTAMRYEKELDNMKNSIIQKNEPEITEIINACYSKFRRVKGRDVEALRNYTEDLVEFYESYDKLVEAYY